MLSRRRRRPPFPFPPGPKGLPFIRNLLDVPSKYHWLAYENWAREIGSDIIHTELFGTHIIVLNSSKVANDLLEKRSSIYSDRYAQIKDRKWVINLFPYCDKWRNWYKTFHAHFKPTMIHKYHPIEVKAAQHLLRSLFDTPEDFMQHLRRMVGRVSLSVAYGIELSPRNDPNMALADAALAGLGVAQTKGRIFNLVPFFMRLPWWFPGAGFKKDADMWKRKMDLCRDEPYEAVKRALEENKATSSIAASMLAGLPEKPTPEEILMTKALPSNATAALQSFVLAMVLYPEVQRRAQEEIDSVVGHGNLPDFGDEESLPYLKAVLYELLRWSPPAPFGIPHRLIKDDVYEGYFIPAKSLVFPNIWAIFHDPATYPEPSKFKPERFLDTTTPVPLLDVAFGFGRRLCPGRYFARNILWVAMASMLATFEFLPVTDAEGRPVPPLQEFTPLLTSGPMPFKCTIRSRSSRIKETIIATLQG
ncbi:cytochrome P450 [Multifurca ochricompacta]|uniref:Cytochrome P450 n=1 Tax=Multifurca ochricompacta TaxID=376703 RepID=A0AAD4QRB9_9AGAM|nr:cytochrome P450 [Multifurca ochricompacta]